MKTTNNPHDPSALDDIGCNERYCEWPNRHMGGLDRGLQYSGDSWAEIQKKPGMPGTLIHGFYSYWNHPSGGSRMKREVCEGHFKALQYWGVSGVPDDWHEEIWTNEFFNRGGKV